MDKKTFILFISSFLFALFVIILFSFMNGDDLLFLNKLKNRQPKPLDTIIATDVISSEISTTTPTSTPEIIDESDGILIDTNETIGPETIRIAFVGDMMFDRYIRKIGSEFGYGYILENVEEYLNKLDLVVGNLEGAVTALPSESIDTVDGDAGHYLFTFSPNILPVLENAGFQAVNIGNNHINNFGTIGLEETRTFLTSAGIHFFGDPYKEERRSAALLVDTVSVGLVSYNQFINPDSAQTISEIQSFINDKADLIVVYTHWGDEYKLHPNQNQKDLARSFIDAGADIVIGSHPHVIQDKELYNGKYIYYSLGNFVFDQYFNDDVKCGAIVEVLVNRDNKDSYKTKETFISLEENGQTILSDCKTQIPKI